MSRIGRDLCGFLFLYAQIFCEIQQHPFQNKKALKYGV